MGLRRNRDTRLVGWLGRSRRRTKEGETYGKNEKENDKEERWRSRSHEGVQSVEEAIARNKTKEELDHVRKAVYAREKVGDKMGKHIKVKEGETRKPGWMYFIKGPKLTRYKVRMARGAKRGHR